MCHPVHKQHHLTIVQCTLKDVNDMLYHHDICKTDRTWYFRRLVLGRHLPTSYEEREYLSYQRPIGTLFLDSLILPQPAKQPSCSPRRRRWKPLRSVKFGTMCTTANLRTLYLYVEHALCSTRTWPWFRRPTSGKNMWSTREYTKRKKLH